MAKKPKRLKRSAGTNAALGIAAATPFLTAAAQAAKEKLTGPKKKAKKKSK
jgi:hypothetical protein